MAKRKDELIFLQNHIKKTNEQGQQLEQIIERMLDMEDRVENRVSYVEGMVEEIKKEVPITYEQQKGTAVNCSVKSKPIYKRVLQKWYSSRYEVPK